jgi:hypothetical protein
MLRLVALALLALCVCSGEDGEETRPAIVSGSVVSDGSGEALPRALVVLKPVEPGLTQIVAESDDHGRFVFYDPKPGSYFVQARRDGYLPSSNVTRGRMRVSPILAVNAGARLRGLKLNLRPWGVITGKVKFDTSEPGVGIAVQVWRRQFARGRRTWVVAASTRTNDLGEYRVHGLTGGDYFVSAAYIREVPQDAIEQDPVDEEGHRVPAFAYATTFYPSALKLGDAVPVHATPGQEVGGVDIFLKPVPVARLRGRIINGGTGAVLPGAGVTLRRTGGTEGESVSVPLLIRPFQDGFEIRGVTSGPYVLVADTEDNGRRYSAKYQLTVVDAPIDNIELVLAASKEWPVRVREDGQTTEMENGALRVTLEPRSDLNPIATAEHGHNDSLRLFVAPDESYDVMVTGAPVDSYVKSIRIGNQELLGSPVAGSAAGPATPLELTLGMNGGRVAGRAYSSDGRPAGGATIAVVPQAGPSWPQWYRFSSADDYGVFQIRGLAPGEYTVFAYNDDPPCEFYDPDELPACRTKGRSISAGEGSESIVDVPLSL